MWFKNLQLFRVKQTAAFDVFEAQLADRVLQPCSGAHTVSRGWVPPRAEGAFVHAVNRQWLIALGVEKRLLPASVVRQRALERQRTIESEQGRRVGACIRATSVFSGDEFRIGTWLTGVEPAPCD